MWRDTGNPEYRNVSGVACENIDGSSSNLYTTWDIRLGMSHTCMITQILPYQNVSVIVTCLYKMYKWSHCGFVSSLQKPPDSS